MSASEMELEKQYEALQRRLFSSSAEPNDYGGIVLRGEPQLSEVERLKLVLRVFRDSGRLRGRFGDERMAIGLQNLVSSNSSEELTLLQDAAVDERLRLEVIAAMKTVFKECFLPRCTPHLLHLDEKGYNPLNTTCYMWWEHVPLFGEPGVPERRRVDDAAIEVMKETLELPSAAVQEAALHGLGHWAPEYRAEVERIIDGYLLRGDIPRPELIAYAKKARTGMIN
jgi:hypothetical protein